MDRPTRQIIRRCERSRPGELVHVGIKKLGNIPTAAATGSCPDSKPSPTGRPPPRCARLDEWAYVRPYSSNAERTDALADFPRTYNYHWCHTALDGQPPISRVSNPASQCT